MTDFATGLQEFVDDGLMTDEEAADLLAIETQADNESFELPYGEEPWGPKPILVADFKGTGLGKKAIESLATDGVTTVEQLSALGAAGINDLRGVSDVETEKILARIDELLGVE